MIVSAGARVLFLFASLRMSFGIRGGGATCPVGALFGRRRAKTGAPRISLLRRPVVAVPWAGRPPIVPLPSRPKSLITFVAVVSG